MDFENKTTLNNRKKYKSENKNDECNVSKASNELMLDRISVVNEKEFPFSNPF